MAASPWSCLPIVTKKSYNKEIFFLSTPPNVVTPTWAGVRDKKNERRGFSAVHTQTIPIIEHITNAYLKQVAD
jgi:hypothetical protein